MGERKASLVVEQKVEAKRFVLFIEKFSKDLFTLVSSLQAEGQQYEYEDIEGCLRHVN